jgi:hypothetical protein
MELEVFFIIIQQTYSKLVISFMNRTQHIFFFHFRFLSSSYQRDVSKKFGFMLSNIDKRAQKAGNF